MFALEQRVIGYATKYFEAKVAFDVSKAELDFLKRPEDPSVLGLDARVDRYLDEKAAGTWQDPRGIEDLDEALKRPLRFYGGHCALSIGERVQIAEDQVCCYYKCRIKDMIEAADHAQSQIGFLLGENRSLRKEVLRLEAVEESLRKKVADLEQQHEDTLKIHAQKLEKITDNHFMKMRQLKADMKNQKEIFERELELSEQVRSKLENLQEKMSKEYTDLAQVVRVPRLHYKEIEKLDYEELQNQHRKYLEKEKELLKLKRVDKTKMRTEQILGKSLQSSPLDVDLYEKSLKLQALKQTNHINIKTSMLKKKTSNMDDRSLVDSNRESMG